MWCEYILYYEKDACDIRMWWQVHEYYDYCATYNNQNQSCIHAVSDDIRTNDGNLQQPTKDKVIQNAKWQLQFKV